jgi:hypothetical protein
MYVQCVQITMYKTHFQLSYNYNTVNYFFNVAIFLLSPHISMG